MHYTPGPWKVYEADCFPGYYGIDTRGKPSTSVVVFGKKSGIPKKEDARLIAAAPDLLEALQAVCEAYGCECVDEGPNGHCPMCQGRAAIAKATGGQ